MRVSLRPVHWLVASAAAFMLAALAMPAATQAPVGPASTTIPAATNLVKQGRALVTAGDCAGCHGTTLKGGSPINSPMGAIYASNITPDRATGIGRWTLAQFRALLRRGEAPDHHIYPAMPYTSFTGLSDAEIAAIYAYLMHGVRPVTNQVAQTRLPFPFIRPAMIMWDALFLKEGQSVGAVAVRGAQLERGRMLVESLEHCTACHTPRGALMQQRSDRHLGGAMESGWWAPNITSDPSGLATWSDQRIATFLRTGHTAIAVAGDDMGTAVARSLSKLPNSDIAAIIAYLRVIPPVKTPVPQRSRALQDQPIPVSEIEPATDTGWRTMIAHDTTRGDLLYQSACASCHGRDGNGSAGLVHPSLRLVNGVVAPEGATLVHAIAGGVNRTVGTTHTFMPGFRAYLSDEQIASLANYVRTHFGGVESRIDAAQVRSIVSGEIGTPWVIRNAHWLSIVAIVVAVIVLLLIVRRLSRRPRRTASR